jgi:hypothetical protein
MADDDEDLAEFPAPKRRSKPKAASQPAKVPPQKPGVPPANAAKAPPAWLVYLLFGVVMVPVLGFAIFMAVRQEKNEETERQAFAAEMDQLTLPPKEGSPPPLKPGKFAVINVGQRALHGTHQRLWEDQRARSPAEADYIVQLREERDQVATYSSGSKGIKVPYHLVVLDKPTWTVVGEKTFVGSDPPLVTVGHKGPDSDVVGTPPSPDALNDYYHELIGTKPAG